MSDLLVIRDLCKSYGDFALQNVGFSVPEGCVVGLVGGNGAGKTTAIKAALGIVHADSGSIRLFGEETADMSSTRFSQVKQHIGVVFDTCSFPSDSTVKDIGAIMASSYAAWDRRRFADLTEAWGLSAKKKASDLSRGMGMKLSLACALSHDADLLILDEATAGLDPLAREDALDALRGYLAERDGRGILMSSHITSDLEKIADYLVCIEDGRIAFSCEKDVVTGLAGIAHCREADVSALLACGLFVPGTLRAERRATETAVLVPDRFAFAGAFPRVQIDPASIDDYLSLTLRGDVL